jgi:glycerol-3-phosphate O-acyltransferase
MIRVCYCSCNSAVQGLGSAVTTHHLLEPVYRPVARFELSYYRNAIDHIFISQAMV